MSTKKYDEASVLKNLARRKGISIDYSAKTIRVSSSATDVGNSAWGKIDYLTNYCGWVASTTKITNNKQKDIIINSEIPEINNKVTKRENKINLVKQVKNIMKKVNVK